MKAAGALAAFLILITALVRLGTSLYLPALPGIGAELVLSPHQLASTMTVYLAVFAAASVLLGPLSDRLGRRWLIHAGLIMYGLGSLAGALAQGYWLLLAGRFLQAIGGSAIPVATRAMTRDAFDDRQMIGVLGWIGTITGMVPVLAPVLGGVLTQSCGWRSNFYLLTGVTVMVGLFAHRRMPETLTHADRTQLTVWSAMRTYATMLATPGFMLPLLPLMCCFAAQGAYLVGSPMIFIGHFHLSPALFGFSSLVLVGGLLAGRTLCLACLRRWTAYATYVFGSCLALLGGLLGLLSFLAGTIDAGVLLLATGIFCLGFGTLMPLGMRAGLSAFPGLTGTSSALFGCLTLGATAAGSAALGALLVQGPRDVGVMCWATFAAGLLTLLTALPCRRALADESRVPVAVAGAAAGQ